MKFFWFRFKTKKYFLLKYLLVQNLLIGLFAFICHHYEISTLFWGPVQNPFLMLPLALVLGIKLPSLMHNAVHDNFSRFNRAIGELSSQFILLSFGIVCINHTAHHTNPDSAKDPHSPIGKSFIYYLFTCLHSGVDVLRNEYCKNHGEGLYSKLLFNLCAIAHFAGIPLRLAAWYFLLGPELALFLYLPALGVFYVTFAHVNYVTHGLGTDGKPVIFNMDSNLWYKFVNYVGDGIYYHKNHHANPNLYNPKQYQLMRTRSGSLCKATGKNLGRIASIF